MNKQHSTRLNGSHFSRTTATRDANGVSDNSSKNQVVQHAQQTASQVAERLENVVRSRPLTSLAVAGGIGALVAFWSKRR